MDNNFQILTEHPTAKELLSILFGLIPNFKSHWESDSNFFVESDGIYSVHGIFSEFSNFIRDNFSEIDESVRKELFLTVEKLVNTNPNFSGGVSNAACTCFLENFTGEGEFSETIRSYLGPKSRKYFDEWDN
jgi:hypothetical protein